MNINRVKSKSDFRKICKEELKSISFGYRGNRDYKVNCELFRLIKKIGAKRILFYIPLSSEVNVLKLLHKVRRVGKYEVFVPFMEGVSFKMVKYKLPLYKKKFGIREPKNSFAKVKKIDLAIVPVLGVDGAFRRVGFGKGMYDRFFESLPYRPYIAFVELKSCFTKRAIGKAHDIQADIYITPEKIIKKR